MMTRPIYETPADLLNEQEVASYLERRWMVKAAKLKMACGMDYSLTRDGKIVAVMEIKRRFYSAEKLDDLGGLILSAHKWQSAMKWRDTHDISFVLALKLTDGLYIMRVKPDEPAPKLDLITGGRTDRNDAQDIEPCVLIPMFMFKKLK